MPSRTSSTVATTGSSSRTITHSDSTVKHFRDSTSSKSPVRLPQLPSTMCALHVLRLVEDPNVFDPDYSILRFGRERNARHPVFISHKSGDHIEAQISRMKSIIAKFDTEFCKSRQDGNALVYH